MPFWFFKRSDKHIHKKVNSLEKNIADSFDNLKKDMGKVGFWINNFKDKHHSHDKRLNAIEQRLNELFDLIKDYNVDEGGSIEHVQSFNRSDASFTNVQSIKNLTPAQKQVLILLAYAGGPLDYESISNKLKLNMVTIRRYINDIKRSGVPINEKVSVRNRRKIFVLDKKVRESIIGVKKELKAKNTKNES